MIFHTLTRLCNHHHNIIPENFHHPQKKPKRVSSHSPFLLPISPWQPLESSLYIELHILDTSYKWNYTTCSFLCLASFTEHVFKIHPCWNVYQNLILFYSWIKKHSVIFWYEKFYRVKWMPLQDRSWSLVLGKDCENTTKIIVRLINLM